MNHRFRPIAAILWLFSFVYAAAGQTRNFIDDEPPEFLNGLLGSYQTSSTVFTRVDEDLQFDWSVVPLDERINRDRSFAAKWSGFLQAKDNGEFRLKVYVAGEVKLRMDDRLLLHAKSEKPAWFESEPLDLRFGRYPIAIEYQSLDSISNSRFGLFWIGPSFQLEPVASRYLWHRSEESPDTIFDQGRLLSRGLRCVACHTQESENPTRQPLPAPSLKHLNGNLNPDWLVQHISEQPPVDRALPIASRRMPYFGLDQTSALAIAAALAKHSAAIDLEESQDANTQQTQRSDKNFEESLEKGATLFASLGCLGCHQLGTLGEKQSLAQQVFSGGDLSQVGDKRPATFFTRWLKQPQSINSDHRMPVFDLSSDERRHLQTYLAAQRNATHSPPKDPAGDSVLGAKLIREHRCNACHQMPDALASPLSKIEIGAESNWEGGCLTSAKAEQRIPGYGLTRLQRRALQTYFTQPTAFTKEPQGHRLLQENNCLGCHSRGLDQGISPQLSSIAKAHPQLANRLAALSPPALTGVGDKYQDAALEAAILRNSPPLRPWLDIRMPKFAFTAEQASALTKFLIGRDRIPEGGAPLSTTSSIESQSETATTLAAARLVTSDGFGCQSCHQIGDVEAPKVDLKARGTNLQLLGKRLRESWFHRWVRNPSRIVPRMEMPAVQTAARGILEDDLDLQLAALWKVLNEPDFQPPRPNPVRIVRNHNLPGLSEQTKLITGVFRTTHGKFVRPLVFGLPNRHNFLFDLEQGRLAAWWIGDVALQHTDGKTWYWEPGSPLLNVKVNQAESHSDSSENSSSEGLDMPGTDTLEQIQVMDSAGRIWRPKANGQVAVSLDRLAHARNGFLWHGRLQLAHQQQTREIPVEQLLSADSNTSVIETTLRLEPGEQALLLTEAKLRPDEDTVVFAVSEDCQLELQGQDSQISLQQGVVHIASRSHANEPAKATVTNAAGSKTTENKATSNKASGDEATVSWRSIYRTTLPQQSFPIRQNNAPVPEPKTLECVPGYEAVQLPLPRSEMPIAFAWDESGEEFYIGSLKGAVLRVLDSDGDGWHDQYQAISDHFPTPFGLHHNADGSLDALTKFALVRLKPTSGDNPTRDAVIVADGWGYTDDYHDWAVGLEQDPQGNYWIALPCQQDDRSPEAAYLRGHAVKLVPNRDSATLREFRLESFAAGLRFPMGIALSPTGDLFTTDNQGNYNPFNELNHLRSGKRYGFINKLENVDGFSPPFESPAINLPHPWSRSVNGICWLLTPPQLQQRGSDQHFGAFEGHLVGCEMNGRSLIRMSLQKVGDTFQGAAYAFSRPNLSTAETFEGPIACEVAPDGDLYIGNLQDSGWGAGQNTGSIVRLRPNGELPVGIAEVAATANSFVIRLTQPVDVRKAADPMNYEMRSYRRISTPAYGGDDQDQRNEQPQSIEVSESGTQITLRMKELRQGYVYELNLGDISLDGNPLFPNQAHYTMRRIPSD